MRFDLPDDIGFRLDRDALYTIDELLNDDLDHRMHHLSEAVRNRRAPDLLEAALAQRLHDYAIDNALEVLLAHYPRVVAIMGGHATRRDDPAYLLVAELGRQLTRDGYFVATGGGPGSMEAANLGAWLAAYPDHALDAAIGSLAVAPGYDHADYLASALGVRDHYPNGTPNLSIPTWFYGHEPTNVFATGIAKYFSNSLREDGLLAIATHGVLYTQGSAGTVQEVFMDAAQNHYGTFKWASPMVFVDRDYWTRDLPVVGLVQRLAAQREYGDMIAALDHVDEIVAFIGNHPPRAIGTDGLLTPP